jgi:hypothetical protein
MMTDNGKTQRVENAKVDHYGAYLKGEHKELWGNNVANRLGSRCTATGRARSRS